MNLETRIYQALLRLYPRDFRQEYGEEMTRVFQESLKHESSSFGFWARVIWDVISSAGRERMLGGQNMKNVLVKFGGIATVIHGLVLPLLAILLMTKIWEPTRPIDGMMLFTNLLFNGLLLPFIVVAGFFHLSQPRSRVEVFGYILSVISSMLFVIGNQLLIQTPSLIPISWIGWMVLIGQFGLPVGLAIMGLARVRQTGVRDLPSVSKILFGLAVVLFIAGTIWRVVTSNTLASDVIEPLGMTVFLVERLIWIPLAWVMLTNQKPSLQPRALT